MLLTYEKGKKDKIHISVDGEYAMTVDCVFWYSLGIPNKSDINEEELAELKRSVNSRRAYNKAIELISWREHSRKELITKLKQRGYGDVAEETADKLEEKGYLNDERFANMLAEELKTVRSFGRKRIAQELYMKGVSRDIISQVLENTREDPENEIAQLIERKYARYMNDEKGRLRAFNGLIRLGYEAGDIKRAVREYDSRHEEETDQI
ncbi:MAG: regulatory protein RecX [Acutalibacteraceae bacterium]